jgi:hypothetical protein
MTVNIRCDEDRCFASSPYHPDLHKEEAMDKQTYTINDEKPPLRELIGRRFDDVRDLREQDLDHLQDAITIRRNEIMASRLEKRGIQTRICKDFDDGPAYHFSYILVCDPEGELPNEWADLGEARRLLDTARNLGPAEAFRRWREKVAPLAHETYTRADALRDVRAERAEADQMYRDGQIDAETHRMMHRDARDYLDMAEE